MTELSALVDPMHNQEAHIVDAAVHRPQRVSLYRATTEDPGNQCPTDGSGGVPMTPRIATGVAQPEASEVGDEVNRQGGERPVADAGA
jgi:hypothetical protein